MTATKNLEQWLEMCALLCDFALAWFNMVFDVTFFGSVLVGMPAFQSRRIWSLTYPVRHLCEGSLKTDITFPKHGEAKHSKACTNNKRQQLPL